MAGNPQCTFRECYNDANLFYLLPVGVKCWFCVKHYDEMAQLYRDQLWDDDENRRDWARKMVDHNGW